MAVYLVTDPDGTRRVAPKTDKTLNFMQKHNALQGEDKRYKWEEYPNDEAAEKFIQENGVRDNQHSPIPKVQMLSSLVKDQQAELSAKDLEIAQLRAMVENASKPIPHPEQPADPEDVEEMTGAEKTALIKEAKTVAEINKLLENETRSTVLAAGEKAILKLKVL